MVCTAIDTRSIPTAASATGIIPLVVTRTASPTSVVNGTLYWRVQAVGTAFGLTVEHRPHAGQFLLVYIYRGQTYYYKAMTFKAST